MTTKVKAQRLETGAVVENLGYSPDKRPLTGSGAPTSTPEYVGQQYIDTDTNNLYYAIATSGETLWEEAGSGSFDPTGYYDRLHAGLADNLYTDDNVINIDIWNFRTTAGSESVPSSGVGILNSLKGAAARTVAKTGGTLSITATSGIYVTNIAKYEFIDVVSNTTDTYVFTLTSSSWDTDPATYGITVTLQQQEFSIDGGTFSDSTGDIFKAYVTTERGIFYMSYNSTTLNWDLTDGNTTWSDADPTTFGITTPASTDDTVRIAYFDECTDGTLSIDFTEETQGTIVVTNPVKLLATGVNQYDGLTYIDNAEIDGNGEIVAGNNKVCFAYAYGGVTNGYMAYSEDGYLVNCGRCEGAPTTGTTLDQTGANVSSTECSMGFADTGYFVVEVLDDTNLSIHPKRSGEEDTNTDAYETTEVDIPTEDVNSTALPTDSIGLPALGSIYDEIDLQVLKYTNRVQFTAFSYASLASLVSANAGNPDFVYDYDENYIYYYDGTTRTYDVSGTFEYTANDYGTERFLDSNGDIIDIPLEANTSYGSNLIDKLRTGVVTKEEYPQVMDIDTYDDLPNTKNTDGIIRLIYTEE